MSKLEMLHQTIRQMTRSEKRAFRLKMNNSGKKSNNQLIFDYLVTQKTLDIDAYKEFVKTHDISSHQMLAGYLLDKLGLYLHRLRAPIVSNIGFELKQMNEKAAAMVGLGFFHYASKLYKKILHIADRYNEPKYAEMALCTLYYMAIEDEDLQEMEDFEYKDGVKLNIYQRLKKINNSRRLNLQLVILYYNAFKLYLKAASPEEWEVIPATGLLDNVPENSNDKIAYYRTMIWYVQHTKGTEEALSFQEKLLDVYRQDTDLTLSKFDTYILDTYYYIFLSRTYVSADKFIIMANRFNNFLDEWIERLKTLRPSEYKFIVGEFQIHNSIIQAKKLTLQTYQLQDIYALDVELNWKNSSLGTDMVYASFLLDLAYLCILIREYDAFYEYEARIRILINNISNPDAIENTLHLAQLLELYENNTATYFQHRLQAFEKKMKQQNNSNPIFEAMIRLLKKLRKSNSPGIVLEEALPQIKEIEKQYEKGIIRFSIWIKRGVDAMTAPKVEATSTE